ncbi:MAG: threonine/serine exporter family protein [Candidatus Ruminococcus intestinipullorum]|nr:threonine/serine exporter family protein [Candidatus Ruminococcus intestinipullorum]
MDYKLLMNVAVLAGEIMLRSGAETYRVEDTMEHFLKTAQTQVAEALVLMTGIAATIDHPDMETITVIRRVHSRGTNMYRIVKVNEISRKYCAGELSLEQTYNELKAIKGKQYSVCFYNLATICVPAGFAPLFGGGLKEIVASAAIGCILALILTIGKRLQIGGFILNVFSAMGIAVSSLILCSVLSEIHLETVVISAIMPLVPGVAITNAIRDTLRGDYLSGGARMLEAFVIATAVALGVGVGMAVVNFLAPGGILL